MIRFAFAAAALLASTSAMADVRIDFENLGINSSGEVTFASKGYLLTYTPDEEGRDVAEIGQFPCGISGGVAGCATNNTDAYYSFNFGQLRIARADGATFSLFGFDAAQTFVNAGRFLDLTVRANTLSGEVVQTFTTDPGGADVFSTYTANIDEITSVVFRGGPTYGPSEYTLDNIRLSGDFTAPVPEPATWAMMIAGFGLAGSMARRTRSRVGAYSRKFRPQA